MPTAARSGELFCTYSFAAHAAQLDLTDGPWLDHMMRFHIEEAGRTLCMPIETRWFYWIAALLGQGALQSYKLAVPLAVEAGLEPAKIKELVYQSASAVGLSRAYPFIVETSRQFDAHGIYHVDEAAWDTPNDAAGREIARKLHGDAFETVFKTNVRHPWLSEWMEKDLYGTLYARGILTLEEHQCAMFCMLAGLDASDEMLRGCIATIANLEIGMDALADIVASNVMLMGYARTAHLLKLLADCESVRSVR
jgi:4-carboxymuconolactone decarboxylase